MSRGVRGVAFAPTLREKEPVLISAVRERTWPEDVDAGEQDVQGLPVGGDGDGDGDVGYDANIARKVEEARRIRAARKAEALVDDFISVEESTRAYLDEADISFIQHDGLYRHRATRKSKWEDGDEEKPPQASTPRPRSSDSDAEPQDDGPDYFDDGLDEESFDAHRRLDGRIHMSLREDEALSRLECISMIENNIEDEEDRKWELQQIQKGFSSGLKPSREARRASRLLEAESSSAASMEEKAPLPHTSLQAVLSLVNTDLKRSKAQLDEAHSRLSQIQLMMAEGRKAMDAQETRVRESAEALEFYHSLKQSMDDYADMVDELFPRLEQLETEWEEILLSRKNRLIPSGEFAARQQSLAEQKDLLLAEVDTGLVSPGILLPRLQAWQARFPESYEQSFVDLCIPPLLEMFCRLDLVGLDPVAGGTSAQQLLQSASRYLAEGTSEEILKRLLTMFIAPRLTKLLASSYDPLCAEQSRVVSHLHGELSELLPPSSRLLATLNSILERCFLDVRVTTQEEGLALLESGVVLAESLESSVDLAKRAVGAYAREAPFSLSAEALPGLAVDDLKQLVGMDQRATTGTDRH